MAAGVISCLIVVQILAIYLGSDTHGIITDCNVTAISPDPLTTATS